MLWLKRTAPPLASVLHPVKFTGATAACAAVVRSVGAESLHSLRQPRVEVLERTTGISGGILCLLLALCYQHPHVPPLHAVVGAALLVSSPIFTNLLRGLPYATGHGSRPC